ncbi:unnamed protein product [Blepharisma stoltei]|uniref:Translin-associated factor X-interacting protein 1 N-terminal domain-containing protein n=1 Tax=Blepharisma stoltei TaxID=1481888 RepID=A0AAU9JQP6_9CILI|nr:unnamed protein product [Blepharisma stoltei]
MESKNPRKPEQNSLHSSKSSNILNVKRKSLGDLPQKNSHKGVLVTSGTSSPQLSFFLHEKSPDKSKLRNIRSSSASRQAKLNVSKTESKRLILKPGLPSRITSPQNDSLSGSSNLSSAISRSNTNSRLKVPIFTNSLVNEINPTKLMQKCKIQDSKSDPEALDMKLSQDLAACKGSEDLKFMAYQKLFDEIIINDKEFSKLLMKIKSAYEKMISKSYYDDSKEIKRDNIELTLKLEEKNALISSLEKEKLEIWKELKKLKKELNAFKYDEKEPSRLSQNKEISALEKENKDLLKREKKYLKLFSLLKSKGYPIDEGFAFLNSKNHKKLSDFLNKSKESINETVYSNRQEDSEGSSTACEKKSNRIKPPHCNRPNLCSTTPVPKLSSFNSTQMSFQEEFMSNYDKFSESWRGQIPKKDIPL